MTKTVNKKKVVSAALALTMCASLMVGSMAYFTDRASTSASATAGTVSIDYATNNIENIGVDADGKNIFNPGDARFFDYTVENLGNKSIDVKETLYLRSSVPMTEENGQAQYEIYLKDDVEEIDGMGYAPKADAQPLTVRSMSDDGKVITYNIPEYVLNGDDAFGDEAREIEAGIDADSQAREFVLVFRGSSDNSFQNSTVELHSTIEAKQHRNTANVSWESLQNTTVSVGPDGSKVEYNVVPGIIVN